MTDLALSADWRLSLAGVLLWGLPSGAPPSLPSFPYLGIRHGGYCLGCCWALFAVLVAAGVMSLGWMLLLSLVVFAENVLPCSRHVSAIVGGLLLILGAGVLGGVVAFPWLA